MDKSIEAALHCHRVTPTAIKICLKPLFKVTSSSCMSTNDADDHHHHGRKSGWNSGGRMARAEGGSVPNGVGMGSNVSSLTTKGSKGAS